MALNREAIRVIRKAIRGANLLRFRYFPNKFPRETIETNYRYVYPIRLFSRNGKKYMLGLYYSGASVSKKGFGYRLFFQKNIYDVTAVYTSKKVITNFSDEEVDSKIFRMILKNEIE